MTLSSALAPSCCSRARKKDLRVACWTSRSAGSSARSTDVSAALRHIPASSATPPRSADRAVRLRRVNPVAGGSRTSCGRLHSQSRSEPILRRCNSPTPPRWSAQAIVDRIEHHQTDGRRRATTAIAGHRSPSTPTVPTRAVLRHAPTFRGTPRSILARLRYHGSRPRNLLKKSRAPSLAVPALAVSGLGSASGFRLSSRTAAIWARKNYKQISRVIAAGNGGHLSSPARRLPIEVNEKEPIRKPC